MSVLNVAEMKILRAIFFACLSRLFMPVQIFLTIFQHKTNVENLETFVECRKIVEQIKIGKNICVSGSYFSQFSKSSIFSVRTEKRVEK